MVANNESQQRPKPSKLKVVPVNTVTKHYYNLERELQMGDEIMIKHEGGELHEEVVLDNDGERVQTLDLIEGPLIALEAYFNEREADGRRYLRHEIGGEVGPNDPRFENLRQKYGFLKGLKRGL